VSMPFAFLSEEWIAEVRSIRDEYRDVASPPPTPSFRANLIVSEVPFGDGKVLAHTDTTDGGLEIELGHLPDADLTVTLDYEMARVLVIDQAPEVIARAWMMGKIRVDGDLTKLLPSGDPSELVLAATEAAKDPAALELGARIRAATAAD
jgi:hypothetical protein